LPGTAYPFDMAEPDPSSEQTAMEVEEILEEE
jgi:hypothetical protein